MYARGGSLRSTYPQKCGDTERTDFAPSATLESAVDASLGCMTLILADALLVVSCNVFVDRWA